MTSTSIIVRKSERRLDLIRDGELRKIYRIALGPSPIGDKQVEGDGKTPEGEFYIFTKNPRSKFTLSLGLSYPSRKDAERGLAAGLISNDEYADILAALREGLKPPQKTALGGEIYIHGGGLAGDWTKGCIAMADDDIRELFEQVERGDTVTILP